MSKGTPLDCMLADLEPGETIEIERLIISQDGETGVSILVLTINHLDGSKSLYEFDRVGRGYRLIFSRR